MKSSIILWMVLFSIWLLWSGHYTKMLVTIGAASCVAVVWLCHRMRVDDEEGIPLRLGLRPFVYAVWLVRQIVIANLDVTRRILDRDLPIRPALVSVKSTQKTDLGRVILANSITLTPGTVSVDMVGDSIRVHALTHEGAEQDISGEMNRRVSKVEGTLS